MRRRAGLVTGLLLLLTAVPLLSRATAGPAPRTVDLDGNKIFDDLDDAMSGRGRNELQDVIVLFKGGSAGAQAVAAERSIGAFTTKYVYRYLPAVAARMTVGQVRALAARSETLQIQSDAPTREFLASARASFGSDQAQQAFGVDGNNEAGACPGAREYCPDDVVIAVIDSGIDTNHVDLDNGKILQSVDCSNGDACWPGGPDFSGHGTSVASVAAGEGDGDPALHGVAPGAAVVNVKAMANSVGTVSGMDRALEWVIANRVQLGIDELNMSMGTSTPGDGTESTARLVNQAAASGIIPFVAAGNGGATGVDNVGNPADAKYAVTVGAMNDPDGVDPYQPRGYNLWYGSSRGPTLDGRAKPDIAAPGVDVTAARAGTGNGYASGSGTSISAPFTAGVGALMLDANPTLVSAGAACPLDDATADCLDGVYDATMTDPVKDMLMATAMDWGPFGVDSLYGAGRLDAFAAVDAASPEQGVGPTTPTHLFGQGSLAKMNASASFTIPVTGTRWPISITMVEPTAIRTGPPYVVTPDFNITLISPSGQVVATPPVSNMTQENIGFQPTIVGAYTLRVKSASGSGPFWFDVAFDGGSSPAPSPSPSTTASPAPTESPAPTASPSPIPPADTTAPSTPTGVKATGGKAAITVSWTASTDPGGSGVAGYRIYRSTSATGVFAEIGATSATSVKDTAVTVRTTYYYYVIAYDGAGNSSGRSSTVSAKST